MSYRLDLSEPIPDALRAVAVERLERAVKRLRDDHGEDPVEAVHGARKDLKKTRALLRLARPGLPPDVYRRENVELRDIGRAMSAGRDADVMVETADALGERFGDQHPRRQFAALHRRLAANARRHRVPDADVGSADRRRFEARPERVAGWPLGGQRREPRCAPARSAPTAPAGARWRPSREDPSDERLHEWRKRVKDLWYHQRLLGQRLEGPAEGSGRRVRHARRRCWATTTTSRRWPRPEGLHPPRRPPSTSTRSLGLIARATRGAAGPGPGRSGGLVYAETPKAHARRIGGYLSAPDATRAAV